MNDKGDVAYLGVPHHTEEDGAGSSFLSYLPDQGASESLYIDRNNHL